MSNNFNELDNLTLEQKRQLLILIAALVESAETKQNQVYDSGNQAQKLAVMQDMLGLVKLRHEIKDMRDALEKSASIRTTSLIDPVLRYIENAK